MTIATSTGTNTDPESEDAWPWNCLSCGTTIYTDAECCRDCESAHLPAFHVRQRDISVGFVDWMRRETVPTFVRKITVIASIELSLTTLWLYALLIYADAFGRVTPAII